MVVLYHNRQELIISSLQINMICCYCRQCTRGLRFQLFAQLSNMTYFLHFFAVFPHTDQLVYCSPLLPILCKRVSIIITCWTILILITASLVTKMTTSSIWSPLVVSYHFLVVFQYLVKVSQLHLLLIQFNHEIIGLWLCLFHLFSYY